VTILATALHHYRGLNSLVGIGIDSGIKSIAAILVGLRLSARPRQGVPDERRERRALKLVASMGLLHGEPTLGRVVRQSHAS
jgi:hypothetical protein